MTSLENSANDDLEKKKKRRRRLLPLLLLLLLLLLGGGGVLAGKLLTPKGDRLARTPQEFRKKAEMKKDEVQKILQNAFYCVNSAEEMIYMSGPNKRVVASCCSSGYYDEKEDVLYFTGVFLKVPKGEYDREHAVVFPTQGGNAEFLLSPELWGKTLLFAVHHPAGIKKIQNGEKVKYGYKLAIKAIRDIKHFNGKVLWPTGAVIDTFFNQVTCHVGDMPLEKTMDLAGALPLSERAYLHRANFAWVFIKPLERNPDMAEVTIDSTKSGWAKIEVFGPGRMSVSMYEADFAETASGKGTYRYNGYTLPSDHCLIGIRDGGSSEKVELNLLMARSWWYFIPNDPKEQAAWKPIDDRWCNYQKQEVQAIIASKFGEVTARRVLDAIPDPSMDYYDRTVPAPGGYKIRIFAEAGSQILYIDVIRPADEPC